ncbi:hypothetical protein C265_11221 [Cupriavidus sp. GA3-3]|uniref:hypothetical protein n=1 Tax=Cupriavidus sp. GA3-3 TaxID=1229514 RepID=UPI00032E141A|nr:hypothetical protein [Cupriavidus sp. GA3-3]EON19592.1 hypothetical protein C265_11221 [Cupriavidus sp. GA3-3]
MRLVRRRLASALLGACGLVVLLASTVPAAQAQSGGLMPDALNCDGPIEYAVWRRWNQGGLAFVREELIAQRLAAGDTYALYHFEIYFHNLLAMAQRCQRIDRLYQLAELVSSTYAKLEPAPGNRPGRAWICRGGPECSHNIRLRNTEVMLSSTQFLAFATSLANSLSRARPEAPGDFVEQTARIAREHLVRWSTPAAQGALRKQIAARPEDVKNGSSELFLTDKELWQISIYADLAGMLAARPGLALDQDDAGFATMKAHLDLLLGLVAARITVQVPPGANDKAGKSAMVADLDAGFWRLYDDNRYAGYTGRDKPVVCKRDPARPDVFVAQTQIPAERFAPVANLGWDISHARRLVHFFEAIERNRAEMVRVYGISPSSLPSHDSMVAFARQLRLHVWNQDWNRPLFTNYFSGANGWYRVNYDNGTGNCSEGYPPYGQAESFPTGGYATWPGLHALGVRLYELTQSASVDDRDFVAAYFPSFMGRYGPSKRMIAELMFWPTLVRRGGSR